MPAATPPHENSTLVADIREAVDGLSRQTKTILGQLIRRGERVALLDYPRHGNVGDHAIWLGETAGLAGLRARRIYTCDHRSYSRADATVAIADRLILIHGGGNLGDIWPAYEQFREDIIRDFPNNRIIQLPQSIYFDDAGKAASLRDRIKQHGGVTLMVRDRPSVTRAADLLDVEAVLCPDMAFALGPLTRLREPHCDVMYLKRTDSEARADQYIAPSRISGVIVESRDWLDFDGLEAFLDKADLRYPSIFNSAPGQLLLRGWVYDRRSKLSLQRGIAILSRGRTVVSDRLHGVILSLLAGLPVVPLDNRTGKIWEFISTWLPPQIVEQFAISARLWRLEQNLERA